MNQSKSMDAQLAELGRLKAPDLRAKWRELFGFETHSHNIQHLRKQLARRIQELAEGGLSERALARIEELAKSGHLLKFKREPIPPPTLPTAQVTAPAQSIPGRDPRLPPAGTVLRKEHRGTTYEVTVLDDDFGFQGRRYKSLSKIAGEISGTNWNGFVFFALCKRKAVK